MWIDELKQHAFLAGMADGHLQLLATLAQPVIFEEDELILRAGDRSLYFYLLLSGSVCIEIQSRVYAVCIQALTPGAAFGWSSLLDHHDTLFQVRARERSAALRLDAAALGKVCRGDAELCADLLRRT